MKRILLAGDSWGIGVYQYTNGEYGPIGQGIETILTKLGYNITNISQGGGSNWLMLDRMDQIWQPTPRSLYGGSYNKVEFDINDIDVIIFLQTDIFRERYLYGKQYPTDIDKFTWKILDQTFVDSLTNFNSLDEMIADYFLKFYTKLNSFNKPVICIGGWSQLHPSIIDYSNLINAIPSASKLLLSDLKEDIYLSDPEWYLQLAEEEKFMKKFGTEFKLMSIQSAEKLDLIYSNWHEVHPPIEGYQKIVDNILPYLH
jgi:hypothetical protein